MGLVTFKGGDNGEISVMMFCDIDAEDVFIGYIDKQHGFYRFLPDGISIYCKPMMLIADELARLNKG